MTILCSQRPFAPALLRNMRAILDISSYFNDLTLIGQDGQLVCSGLLISAISPLLQSLENSMAVIMLPDFTVAEISTFFKNLTSDFGPETIQDKITFINVLKVFGEKADTLVSDNLDHHDQDDKDEIVLPKIDGKKSPERPITPPPPPTRRTRRPRRKLTTGTYV